MSAAATTPGAGLREKRDRLAAEIRAAEGKAQRLRQSIQTRKETLRRLDAQLVLVGEHGGDRSHHG